MWTVQWQRSYQGLSLTQEIHSWRAGITFVERSPEFNIMQAGTRRPVMARLSHPVGAEHRLGRIVLTPAGFGMPVQTIGDEAAFPVRKFELDAKWLSKLLSSGMEFDFTEAHAQPVFDDPVISATLDRIYDELTTPGRDSANLLGALVRILAVDTARRLMARSARNCHSERGLTMEQLTHIRRLIETTDFKDLSSARIAEDCEMSLPRLRNAFLQTTGTALRVEIEETRVNTACRQLVETHYPLKVIAHRLGFTHASAFCYWFKQSTGLTPTEHRMRHSAVCAGAC